MFFFHHYIPEEILREVLDPEWSLGALGVSQGVSDLIDESAEQAHLHNSLRRHLRGDYGLLSLDAREHHFIQGARDRGVHFRSMYDWNGQIVHIGTDPQREITTVCLHRED